MFHGVEAGVGRKRGAWVSGRSQRGGGGGQAGVLVHAQRQVWVGEGALGSEEAAGGRAGARKLGGVEPSRRPWSATKGSRCSHLAAAFG